MPYEEYEACIVLCSECEAMCEHCASVCLREENLRDLASCIRLGLACAQACRSTAAIMSQASEFASDFCALCARICQACGDECARHREQQYCRECAVICYVCAETCFEIAGARV